MKLAPESVARSHSGANLRPTAKAVFGRNVVRQFRSLDWQANAAAPRQLRRDRRRALEDVYLVQVDPSRADQTADRLRRDPAVEWVEKNAIYSTEGVATTDAASAFNDPYLGTSGAWGQEFEDLWGLFAIGAPEAWEISLGEGVVVAVVDSGIDDQHEDLAGAVWTNEHEIPGNGVDDDDNGFVDDVQGWDFTTCRRSNTSGTCFEQKEPSNDTSDEAGHGTFVSGTIAARLNNGVGIAGVAPRSQVMAVKGLDSRGNGNTAELAAAIVYAAENGAAVINASWGSSFSSRLLELAVAEATETYDAVVVAAAGNGGAPLERGHYPSNLSQVISVGSVTHELIRSSFSNYGGPLDLVAPGGGDKGGATILSPGRSIFSLGARDSNLVKDCDLVIVCDENEQNCELNEICEPTPYVIGTHYVRASGTSFAAAYVSGVVALMRSQHPEFDRRQVRQILTSTAQDLGAPDRDVEYGHGFVDAGAALAVNETATAQITSPENGAKLATLGNGTFDIRGSVAAPDDRSMSWTLSVSSAGADVTVIASGSEPILDDRLGVIDAQSLDFPKGTSLMLHLAVNTEGGGFAEDRVVFLIPDYHYVLLPIPDRFDEGGGAPVLDDEGQIVALQRVGRGAQGNVNTWIFNTMDQSLTSIPAARVRNLSADGSALVVVSELFTPDLDSTQWWLHDLHTAMNTPVLQVPRKTVVGSSCLTDSATDLLFVSSGDFVPPENADRTTEIFSKAPPVGAITQLTNIDSSTPPPQIDVMTCSRNGERIAVASRASLDPSDVSDGTSQIFLYDRESNTFDQLTHLILDPPYVAAPLMSHDGRRIAYQAEDVHVIDFDRGSNDIVLAWSMTEAQDVLFAGRGTRIGFTSTRDLDPTVGNVDLSLEAFVLDIESGSIQQVTDSLSEVALTFALNGDAGVVAFTSLSQQQSLSVHPTSVLALRQAPDARRLRIVAPEAVSLDEETTTTLEVYVDGSDGGLTVFHAEFRSPDGQRVRNVANSDLRDSFRGDAELVLRPGWDESGMYQLRIAAFDTQGGYGEADIALEIRDTVRAGDADCDGHLDEEDLGHLVSAIFTRPNDRVCQATDPNNDGAASAADTIALIFALWAD